MKKDDERRWMRRLVRWGWFACFLGNHEWYRRLYGGLWAHVHVEEPCYSCMWLNCPVGADETYREWNWRGTPEFRNYDSANTKKHTSLTESKDENVKNNLSPETLETTEGQGLYDSPCSASSLVSLREYDRMVTNYDKLRMAVIGDVLPEMSDGYTLLRTDWKVEER